MYITRVRFWVLAVLLFVYLAGVLLISVVTFHEPRNGGNKDFEGSKHNSRFKHLEFGASGFRPNLRRSKISWCSELNFIEKPRLSIALASFPGSGNTWLRYLLQQSTGIYTGSVYKDYGLLKNGFPGESVVNGSVLVVKTHEWGISARNKFNKAILLVRDPSAAIQAEFNRQSGGHIGFASPERYRRTKGKFWQQFVTDKLQSWKSMNLDWLFNFTGPTHVIFYEQLVQNTEYTLRSILNFIDYPVNEKQFQCALERQEGIYRRKKRVLNFDPYSKKMKKNVEDVKNIVYNAVYSFASPSPNR